MVKLSIVTQFYPPDYAATGQLIEELVTQLGRLGMQVQVLTGQPGYGQQKRSAPAVEAHAPLTVRRSRTSRLWPRQIRGRAVNGLLFCLRNGLRLLKPSRRGDVLLVTTEPPYLPFVAYLIYAIFRQPYVCLLYDLYPDVAVRLDVMGADHWLARAWDWLNCRTWRCASAIIVLSPTMKAQVARKCPEIADKIAVIHSWSDPRHIVPKAKADNPFARKHGLTDRFTVLYSGNMGRCHDVETILAAMRELRDDPVRFVFIGGGAKRPECEAAIVAEGLEANSLFLPFQDKDVLPDSLTACDLALVSVSAHMEGLVAPSKLYGILAAGRAVAAICQPECYLHELLATAGCGRAFVNGDGSQLAQFIRELAADPQLCARLGRNGRDYLKKNFTPERIAHQYAKVLTGYL